jgi:tetratricopeptide (TPR) repeat protein
MRAVFSIAVLLSLTAPALSDPKQDVQACRKEADVPACERVMKNPKESKDNLAYAYYVRGTKAYEDSDYKAALADLDRSIALNRAHANAHYNRALAHRRLGDPDRALADMAVYLRTHPDDADAYYQRGNFHFDKRSFDQALSEYARAVKQKPGHETALVGLGKTYLELNDAANAMANFDAAIRVNASATNHVARGEALVALKRLDDAAQDYDAAIKADPSDANAHVQRAWIHSEKKEFARALDQYSQAIRLSPEEPDYYNARGWVHLEVSDYVRARADFEQALRHKPDHGLALFHRARVLTELGQFDTAIADFDAARRAKADTLYIPVYLGWTYAYKGDTTNALAQFQEFASAMPDDAEGPNGLCWVHTLRSEFDKAMPQCDRAVSLAPGEAVPLHTRGVAKFRMGSHALALADIDQAIALKADSASLFSDRGHVHEARGDRARAVADYQKAVVLPSKGYYDDTAKADALRRLTALATAPPQTVAAQPKPQAPQAPERRVALVIGNAAYANVPTLANPKNDARAVAASLRRLGFADVVERHDLTRAAMTRALQEFGELAENADWAVVYYAGHGIEVGGVNYAIPVDAALKASTHVDDEGVSLERVVSTVGSAKKMRLVILDACRDNPFVPKMRNIGGTRSVGRGLGRVEPPPGVLVAYAARDGLVAMDGDTGNSPFATALVEHLEEPGVEINLLFRKIRDRVFTSTRGQQEPYTYGSLPAQQFFFRIAQP